MTDFLAHVISGGDFTRLFPSIPNGIPRDEKLFATHATTIVGVCAKNAVVVCADSQATNTSNLNRYREPVHKLTIVGEHGVVGIAGAPGPGLKSTRLLRIAVSAEQCLTGETVTAEKYGLMLQEIATQLLPMVMSTQGQFAVHFLLGCYDAEHKIGRVMTIDPTGFLLDHHETGYAAIGSGDEHAQNWLDATGYRAHEASVDAALHAGIGALHHAAKNNAGTGGPLYAVTIDAHGAAEFPPEIISTVLEKITEGEGARRNAR